LKTTGACVAGGVLAGCATSNENSPRASRSTAAGSVRVAHLSDFHIQPELEAPRGVTSCLHHVQSQRQKPELILNTGDCVFETLFADRIRTQTQWDVWNAVIKNECSIPIQHCLGNHDIWGWSQRSGGKPTDKGYGKQWALDALGLAKPYHAFDFGTWRIIMLDSVQPAKEGVWETRLDDEQFAWLENELKSTHQPVLIGSHIPIVSPAVFLDPGKIGGTPEAPALAIRRCHMDVKRIGTLFTKYRGVVKLCISGHLHETDRAEFLGTTFLNNPAVCGDWWKGLHRGIWGEMYTLLDLHPDGTFDVEYVDYGWTPVAAPATT
jgi:3',5'-cyclic AMP phosphodiesterase CpdA